MAASDKLLEQVNRTINRFQVSRHGELIENPVTIQLSNKPNQTNWSVVVEGKLVFSGKLSEALTKCDEVELMTKVERDEFLKDKPNYSGE